jgi:hypothetical protein
MEARTTAARYVLRDPGEVLLFLTRLAARLGSRTR